MKKKIALIIALVVMLLALSGCMVGNRKVGYDSQQTFTRASIPWNGEYIEVDIEYWRDFDDSDVVQIETKDLFLMVFLIW